MFWNRGQELAALATLDGSGGLAVVWGRRRIGKTRLLLEWSERAGGVYTVADQSAPHLQRAYFARAISQVLRGFAEVTYPDWERLLSRLAGDARELTERHGILLIADEIQTGFGRTGKFFAIEHSGVTPDLVTVAKSLAAGFPLSAVVGRAEVMDAPAPGGLGGTYAGNPVACAAGLAVMDVMRDEHLPERAARIGSVIEERMRTWAAEHELVGDVRVLGAMAGIELVRDRKKKTPADTETARILTLARERGLLLLRSGMHHNVIRTLMPLTIPDEQLMEGLDILGSALAEVAAVPARSEK